MTREKDVVNIQLKVSIIEFLVAGELHTFAIMRYQPCIATDFSTSTPTLTELGSTCDFFSTSLLSLACSSEFEIWLHADVYGFEVSIFRK